VDQSQFSDPDFNSGTQQRKNVQFADNFQYLSQFDDTDNITDVLSIDSIFLCNKKGLQKILMIIFWYKIWIYIARLCN
jgi:hypothetical protein